MTTHNNHPEDRDVTVSGAEHEPASDTLSTPTSPDQATHHEKDAAVNEEQKTSAGESKTDDAEASPQANSASSFDKTAEDTSHQSADVSSVGDTENVQSDTSSEALASEDDETPTQKSPAVEPQNASIAAVETSEADIRHQAEVSVEPEPPVLSDGQHIPETDEPETPEAEAKAEEEAEDVLLKTVEHEPQPAQDPMPEANLVDQSYTPTMSEQQEIRPFTAFIEEFRQGEEARGFSFQEVSPDTLSLFITPDVDLGSMFNPNAEEAVEPGLNVAGEETQPEQSATPVEPDVTEPLVADLPAPQSLEEHTQENPETPRTSRPVSPLLRPASRGRVPRHSTNRHREENPVSEASAVETNMEAQTTIPAEEATPTPPAEQPRPARRYRFDRPSQSAQTPTPAQPTQTPAPVEETKESNGLIASLPTSRVENGNNGNGHGNGTRGQNHAHATETPTKQEAAPEPQNARSSQAAANSAEQATHAPEHERRRRGSSQERQREKEIAAAEALLNKSEPVVEPETQPATEDLPPLEYSELQAASSRRRRRRRSSSVSPVPAITGNKTPLNLIPEIPATHTPTPTPSAPVMLPRNMAVPQPKQPEPTPVQPPFAGNPYNLVSGYTVNQMNLGNDAVGPFMGPEPTPARGSTPVHNNTRQIRTEVPRTSANYTNRAGEPTTTGFNQFANTLVQAIQSQTDRMVTELRRANQSPTNISVSLPPFPSNERVGVFVDVANLLYSARTLRMTVDFGKLLDFLRGNRRLVRAQAYCPTSPQAGDEQMFLQAVKGLGYRITTKNYKTFSSGAKKADLDLDLCMDVVRLVDGGAVDCIVLVSGDSDFMPMLDYCSDHGVRVEVAAFDEAMSITLRQSCDLFVNLSMLEEIRA